MNLDFAQIVKENPPADKAGKATAAYMESQGFLRIGIMGMCFDSAAFLALYHPTRTIVHGVLRVKGRKLAHAWLEDKIGVYDSIWNFCSHRQHYYEKFKVLPMERYTVQRLLQLWGDTGYPGPWNEKLLKLVGGVPRHRIPSPRTIWRDISNQKINGEVSDDLFNGGDEDGENTGTGEV